MISYFRLLAGFTSLRLNLCFVHFSAIGPSGILESNFMCWFAVSIVIVVHSSSSGKHEDGNKCKHGGYDYGKRPAYKLNSTVILNVVQPQRLERACKSVPEVKSQ